MDPISQAALGAVVAQAASHKTLGIRGAAIGAAAGALPDIDVFFSLNGDYFEQLVSHRGITHSLLFAPIVGPVLGWLVWRFESRRHRQLPDLHRMRVWMLALSLAILSHPLLDFLTPYGTQLLLPFSNARFAISAMPIIDPIYTIALLAGLFVAARNQHHATRIALATLLMSSSYLGYGWYLNAAAETYARNQLAASGLDYAKVAAFPTILQVHYRRVVARSPDIDRVGFISMWDPCEIQWHSAPRLDHALTEPFLASREGAVFDWFTMGWTHFTLTRQADKRILAATDLRYGFDQDPSSSVFTARADARKNGELTGPVVGGRFRPEANGETLEGLIESTYAPACRIHRPVGSVAAKTHA